MPQTTNPARADMPPLALTPDHSPIASGQVAAASDTIPAESLFKYGQEIRILHKGDLYRLRITRNDKLILTK
jgi:hemin uptake protein HemP